MNDSATSSRETAAGNTPVSVALCTCNGSAFLRDQLDSIAAQTRRPSELVICDDRSDDDTAAVVAAFAHDAPFPVSFNVNETRLGVAGNFQRAISLCQSPLIATCDQDDIWLPEKLATLAHAFEDDDKLLIAFSDMALMSHEGHPLGKNQWQQLGFDQRDVTRFNRGSAFEMLLRYNVVTGMAMMFRRRLFDIAQPLDPLFIHDEWLSLIAATMGDDSEATTIRAIQKPLVQYRQHASQKIGGASRNPFKQWRYARKYMGDDYLQKQLQRTEHLREKLASLSVRSDNHHPRIARHCLPLVDEKIAHLTRRIALRQSILSRLTRAPREWRAGNYIRFGHAWRSFAQDLFM